ncbi:acyl acyltransferase [Trichoderma cornu-damae]|uniref:Acyl acyltransferase n=1 Tax=Trichoderma cornu-damae TaxID=654480 RepID=A0A9P8TTD4_9HYPO|nr:acyl acyltransferase [Trichoderma cornu-damae]
MTADSGGRDLPHVPHAPAGGSATRFPGLASEPGPSSAAQGEARTSDEEDGRAEELAAKDQRDHGPTPGGPAEFELVVSIATEEQLRRYMLIFSYSSNDPMNINSCIGAERTMLITSVPLLNFVDKVWVLHHAQYPDYVYTGGITRQRTGLVSTTKGAKLVKGIIISRIVTSMFYRRTGCATSFMRLLAQEIDKGEGQDRIAFSVVYGGSNTDLFYRCG